MKPDRHTIHLADSSKVVIEGDRVEVHLGAPIIVHRKRWIRHFMPDEEVRRTLLGTTYAKPITDALERAFTDVPMTAYPEDTTHAE